MTDTAKPKPPVVPPTPTPPVTPPVPIQPPGPPIPPVPVPIPPPGPPVTPPGPPIQPPGPPTPTPIPDPTPTPVPIPTPTPTPTPTPPTPAPWVLTPPQVVNAWITGDPHAPDRVYSVPLARDLSGNTMLPSPVQCAEWGSGRITGYLVLSQTTPGVIDLHGGLPVYVWYPVQE